MLGVTQILGRKRILDRPLVSTYKKQETSAKKIMWVLQSWHSIFNIYFKSIHNIMINILSMKGITD